MLQRLTDKEVVPDWPLLLPTPKNAIAAAILAKFIDLSELVTLTLVCLDDNDGGGSGSKETFSVALLTSPVPVRGDEDDNDDTFIYLAAASSELIVPSMATRSCSAVAP